MSKTTVVNINNSEHQVYFRIGKDGTRLEVITKFKAWLLGNKKLMNDIMELDGKILGCHCKPKRCHGDVLVEVIEAKKHE